MNLLPKPPNIKTINNSPWPKSSQIMINVMEYGAKADGRTDDTIAIQSAINTAKDAGGAGVYFPRPPSANGYYRVEGTITMHGEVYSGIRLTGEAAGLFRTRRGVRIKKQGNGRLLDVRGEDPIEQGGNLRPIDMLTIENLEFQGGLSWTPNPDLDYSIPRNASHNPAESECIRFDKLEQLRMLNCRVDATGGAGIGMFNMLDCFFTNILIEECEWGIWGDNAHHCFFHQVVSSLNGGHGVKLVGTIGAIFSGCTIRNNNRWNGDFYGVHLSNCHNIMIIGNQIYDDYPSGQKKQKYGVYMDNLCRDTMLYGNYLLGNATGEYYMEIGATGKKSSEVSL